MRRYRLHTPDPFYAGMYTSMQQKAEMCAVAADIARKRRKLLPAAAAAEAATELGLAEDDEDIAFAEAQLQALAEVNSSWCTLRASLALVPARASSPWKCMDTVSVAVMMQTCFATGQSSEGQGAEGCKSAVGAWEGPQAQGLCRA